MQPATTDPSQINTNCQVRSPLGQASTLLRQTRIFTTCLSGVSLVAPATRVPPIYVFCRSHLGLSL